MTLLPPTPATPVVHHICNAIRYTAVALPLLYITDYAIAGTTGHAAFSDITNLSDIWRVLLFGLFVITACNEGITYPSHQPWRVCWACERVATRHAHQQPGAIARRFMRWHHVFTGGPLSVAVIVLTINAVLLGIAWCVLMVGTATWPLCLLVLPGAARLHAARVHRQYALWCGDVACAPVSEESLAAQQRGSLHTYDDMLSYVNMYRYKMEQFRAEWLRNPCRCHMVTWQARCETCATERVDDQHEPILAWMLDHLMRHHSDGNRIHVVAGPRMVEVPDARQ